MTTDAALSRGVWMALAAGLIYCPTPSAVEISDTTYEGRPHFKIVTVTATYFFDRRGGGLSRMIDRDGNDWIAFSTDPPMTAPGPAFTASTARGVPNSVYKLDDHGASHPGFDQCESMKLDACTIRAISKSGQWQWTWVFGDHYAVMTVDKADPSRTYWFLYEGPIGGRFAPMSHYWGTNLGGPRYDLPDLFKTTTIHEAWQWAYFGDRNVHRVLFVAQDPSDDLIDTFFYMGNNRAEGVKSPNGMAVFGFGRAPGAKPLLNKAGLRFFIGFSEGPVADEKGHRSVAAAIMKIVSKGQ